MIHGNVTFWYAVAVLVLALFAWFVQAAVRYLNKHHELAGLQADYQRLMNAYSAWRRVLTPFVAKGIPVVEAVLKPLVKALIEETGLPEATLMEIGAEILHTMQTAITGQPVAPPELPPAPEWDTPSAPAPAAPAPVVVPTAAPASPSPAPAAAVASLASVLPPEAGTPPPVHP